MVLVLNHDSSDDVTEKGDKKGSDKQADKNSQKESKEQISTDGEKGEGEAEQTSPVSQECKMERRLEEGIGIPHLVVDVATKDKPIWDRVRLFFHL